MHVKAICIKRFSHVVLILYVPFMKMKMILPTTGVVHGYAVPVTRTILMGLVVVNLPPLSLADQPFSFGD